jgi:hypothetical protein
MTPLVVCAFPMARPSIVLRARSGSPRTELHKLRRPISELVSLGGGECLNPARVVPSTPGPAFGCLVSLGGEAVPSCENERHSWRRGRAPSFRRSDRIGSGCSTTACAPGRERQQHAK